MGADFLAEHFKFASGNRRRYFGERYLFVLTVSGNLWLMVPRGDNDFKSEISL